MWHFDNADPDMWFHFTHALTGLKTEDIYHRSLLDASRTLHESLQISSYEY